jgi:3D (Asp-Asp-Asp) domain-containing protein
MNVAQVYVTGYSLTGVTATGAEAGPGICAVDPSYIPLGARISIDGFGSCIAADTGPSVVGAHIDVWVPTVDQAYSITGWYTIRW